MSLHIREVTKDNWRAVAALKVAPAQNEFIESNAFSILETEIEKNGVSVGLYDGEILVGYAMYGWPSPENKSAWFDRFMIDHQFQGQGYARRFMPLIFQTMQAQYGCETFYLSLHPDNLNAQKLYESFGFRLNGEVDDAGPVSGVVMEMKRNEPI